MGFGHGLVEFECGCGCNCIWVGAFGRPMVVVGLMSVSVGVVWYGCDSTTVETIDNLL